MAVILLVDPDIDQGEFLRTAIESVGHTSLMTSAVNGGLDQLRGGGIDLVVVHYVDGLRLDLLFSQIERLPDPPPVVLISRRPDAPAMSARFGAVEFLATPCDVIEIVEMTERVLKQRNAPHAFEDSPTRPTERWGQFA